MTTRKLTTETPGPKPCVAPQQHARRVVAPLPAAHRLLLVGRLGGTLGIQRRPGWARGMTGTLKGQWQF